MTDYPGAVDLVERVPVTGGHDRRTEAEFTADLERATDVSLHSSANWRAGRPLDNEERWPSVTHVTLGRRDRPDKGRWASQ